MGQITTVGLDSAKRVVQLHAEDGAGRVELRRTLKRESVLVWFAQHLPCVVGMEACASAHTRPDTELQSAPSLTLHYLHSRGSPYRDVRRQLHCLPPVNTWSSFFASTLKLSALQSANPYTGQSAAACWRRVTESP